MRAPAHLPSAATGRAGRLPGAVQAAVPADRRYPADDTDGLPAGRSRFHEPARAHRLRARRAARRAAACGSDWRPQVEASQHGPGRGLAMAAVILMLCAGAVIWPDLLPW
ncbi:protein of unknown function [Cupriavidus neocaledonicus]|uniref:Uncharacterized protein n=1 Tax=Cupriavidus neocaledonicus TaxID=1040979 RepID=A0A375H8R9_9BURK|nr:exported hypothetical protein [Cupriavidus neocaledonicus]SPD47266.1 protein of unknown function [Cupriavidus neocaledonicus]